MKTHKSLLISHFLFLFILYFSKWTRSCYISGKGKFFLVKIPHSTRRERESLAMDGHFKGEVYEMISLERLAGFCQCNNAGGERKN